MSCGLGGQRRFMFECKDRWLEEIWKVESELTAKNVERRKLKGRNRAVLLGEIAALEKRLRILRLKRDEFRGKSRAICHEFRTRRRRSLNRRRKDRSLHCETFRSVAFQERVCEELRGTTPLIGNFYQGGCEEERGIALGRERRRERWEELFEEVLEEVLGEAGEET